MPQVSAPAIFASLIELGAARLCAELPAVAPDRARRLLQAIADDLQDRHGGTDIYVPSRRGDRLAERNAEIRRAWSAPAAAGSAPRSAQRLAELAHTHGISARQARAIVAAGRGKASA